MISRGGEGRGERGDGGGGGGEGGGAGGGEGRVGGEGEERGGGGRERPETAGVGEYTRGVNAGGKVDVEWVGVATSRQGGEDASMRPEFTSASSFTQSFIATSTAEALSALGVAGNSSPLLTVDSKWRRLTSKLCRGENWSGKSMLSEEDVFVSIFGLFFGDLKNSIDRGSGADFTTPSSA